MRNHQKELIPAKSAANIRGADNRLQNLREFLQQSVATDMSVRVIDALKGIQIDEHDPIGESVPHRAAQLS